MINPKILILPDIHGMKFYCKALCEAVDKGVEIVSLLAQSLPLHQIPQYLR